MMSVCFHLLILDTMFTPWTKLELLHLQDKLPAASSHWRVEAMTSVYSTHLQNRGTSYSKRETPAPHPTPDKRYQNSSSPFFSAGDNMSSINASQFTWRPRLVNKKNHEQSTADLWSTISVRSEQKLKCWHNQSSFFKWSRRLAAAELKRYYY